MNKLIEKGNERKQPEIDICKKGKCIRETLQNALTKIVKTKYGEREKNYFIHLLDICGQKTVEVWSSASLCLFYTIFAMER